LRSRLCRYGDRVLDRRFEGARGKVDRGERPVQIQRRGRRCLRSRRRWRALQKAEILGRRVDQSLSAPPLVDLRQALSELENALELIGVPRQERVSPRSLECLASPACVSGLEVPLGVVEKRHLNAPTRRIA
jgi:hypothetical protein